LDNRGRHAQQDSDNILSIDGSYGEGGGQILRTSLALSGITGIPIKVHSIRAKRRNPGLANQHLTAILAAAEVCNASVSGAEIGSQCIEFHPSEIQAGRFEFDIGTAGSVTLVLQTLIPMAIMADHECTFLLTGGTDVPWSPSVQYFLHVFCEFLERLGVTVRVYTLKHGFYPKGGGVIRTVVYPASSLTQLDLEERGEFQRVDIWSVASNHLKGAHVAERQANAASEELSLDARINTFYAPASSPGSSIHLHAHFTNTKLGAGALGKRGLRAEDVGREAGRILREEIDSGATLDLYMTDQILLYLALAGGGVFTTRELTEHAKSCMWLIEQFLPVRFNSEKQKNLWKVSIARL